MVGRRVPGKPGFGPVSGFGSASMVCGRAGQAIPAHPALGAHGSAAVKDRAAPRRPTPGETQEALASNDKGTDLLSRNRL